MTAALFGDDRLGWGSGIAPPGSVDFAKRWRLDMMSAVDHVKLAPDQLDATFALGAKHECWRVLKDESGRVFSTFDVFCETKRPYGLGFPAARVRAALELYRMSDEEWGRLGALAAHMGMNVGSVIRMLAKEKADALGIKIEAPKPTKKASKR